MSTITISQLPPIGTAFTPSSIIPIVQTSGVVSTDQTSLGNLGNYILTQAGNSLQPAYLSNFAYSVTNAAQPSITSVGTLTGLAVSGISNLGSVINIKIAGGLSSQVLSTDGTGNLSWVTQTGGGNGSTGNVTFSNTTISTAQTLENITIQTYDSSNSISYAWNFDSAGNLTMPNQSTGLIKWAPYGAPSYVNAYMEFGEGLSISSYGLVNLTASDNTITVVDGIVFQGAGYTNDSYFDQPTTGGSGIGLTLNYTVNLTEVVSASVANPGDGYLDGDIVTIPGGSPSATVALYVYTPSSNWHFSADGNLTLPTDTFAVKYANGQPVVLSSANIGNITFNAATISTDLTNTNIQIVGNGTGNVQVASGTSAWTFGNDGNLTIPGTSGAFVMNNIGAVTYSTNSPFSDGSGSLNFADDGNLHYLNVPNATRFAPGTDDFTIEWYQYVTNDAHGFQRPFSLGALSQGSGILLTGLTEGGPTVMAIQVNGGYHPFNGYADTLNSWQHIAVVRNAGDITIYQNGVAFATHNIPNDITYDPSLYVSIGNPTGGFESIGTQFVGQITNMRYVVGTAVYTSNFTPSTTPLTAISGTQLLLLAASPDTINVALAPSVSQDTAIQSGGNINVVSNGNDWIFGTDGNLTLPGGIDNLPQTAIIINQTGGAGLWTQGGTATPSLNYSDFSNVVVGENIYVTTGSGSNQWTFGTDGNLTLPGVLLAQASDNGSIVFSNNGVDNNGSLKVDAGLNMTINANSNFYVKQNSSDRLAITDTNTDLMAASNVNIHANKAGSESVWTFDSSGNLTLPSTDSSRGGKIYFEPGGASDAINFNLNINSFNKTYRFATDGMTLPGGAILNSAYSNGNSNISIPVASGDVTINTQNPNITVNAILNASYGLVDGTYINQPTTALTGTGVGMTVDYTVLVFDGGIDSVSINNPGTGYADGDQITIPVGIPISGAIFSINVGAPSIETWTFSETGNLTIPGYINLPLVAKLNSGGVGVTNSAEFGTDVTVNGSNVINGSQIYMGAGTAESRAIVNSTGNSLMYIGVENPGFAGTVAVDPGVTSAYAIQVGANGQIEIGAVVGAITTTEYVAGMGVLNATGNINGIFANANVAVIGAGDQGWTFNASGNLAAPGAINLPGSIAWPGTSAIFEDSGLVLQGATGLAITSPGTTQITAGSNSWLFTNDGNLTTPGAIITGTGTGGNISGVNVLTTETVIANTEANVILLTTSNISTASNLAITANSNMWTFGANGNLTLPNGAVIKDTSGNSVAVGYGAGASQGNQSVAIGENAGANQGSTAVAIGQNAGGGVAYQSDDAVAIGHSAGEDSQGTQAIAIGLYTGQTAQGLNSIALGAYAGQTNQGNNSIILNATGVVLNQTTANTFTVAPVRNDVANISEVMFYNTTSNEVTYGNSISIAGNINAGNIITGTGTTGNITGANVIAANTFQSTVVAFNQLPSATTPGLRAFINNGNLVAVGNFGAQVDGSGANYVPVFSDGANWCIG